MIVLFAIGLAGASMFVLGALHVPFWISVIVAAIGVAVAGSRFPVARQPATGNRQLATLLAIIPLVAIALTAAMVPLNDFDGRAFWLLKAKALATERSVEGPFFHDNEPRNQYPLLMPLDAASIMAGTRTIDDRWARWLYVVTFAAFVLAIYERLGPWYAAILAWLPQFAVASEGGALSGYSDIAVAAFVACAFFELIDAESPLRFGMWLSFLVLTKNEGLPIAVILLAIGAFSFRRRTGAAAIAPAIATAALLMWRSGIPKTDEENYLALLPSLPSHLGRFLPAIGESAVHLIAFAQWGLVWIAAASALGILAWRREWRAPLLIAAMSALYIGAYMVTQWTMSDLIAASADRLLMQMIGPALWAIAAVLEPSARSRSIAARVVRRDVDTQGTLYPSG